MKHCTTLLAGLLAAPAFAQAQLVAVSAGVQVQVGLVAPATVPPGLDVTNGFARSLDLGTGRGTVTASHLTGPAAVVIDWLVRADALSQNTANALGEVRYDLTLAEPVAGELVVEWTATTSGTGTTAFSVDLFDDQLDVATAPFRLPVTLGPWPCPFRVRAMAVASAGTVTTWTTTWTYRGQAQGALQIRFEPTPPAVQAAGVGCGGPLLGTTGNVFGGAELRLTGAAPGELLAAVVGLDSTPGALPFGGCPLWTTPLVGYWALPDPSGAAGWSLAVPASARPFAFVAQGLVLAPGGPALRSGDALRLTLP